MKIIAFADPHVGVKNYGRIDRESGLNEREVQTLDLLSAVIDHTLAVNADVLLFAGDMYKNSVPSPTLMDRVNAVIVRAATAGVKVLLLDGNHDVSRQSTFDSGLAQFATLNVPNVVQTRFFRREVLTVGGQDYRFVFLPTHHTRAEIIECMDELDDSLPTIVIGHLAMRHAKLNDWNIIDNEECIEIDDVTRPSVVAVVLGHLHKHQVLSTKPLVFYTGSTNRIDFTEEKQPKGFVELDVDGYEVTHKFIELTDAQRFVTLDVTADDHAETAIVNAANARKLTNAIVRVRLDCPDELVLDEKVVIDALTAAGAHHVLRVQRQARREAEASTADIDASLEMYEVVDRYFADQKRGDVRSKLAKAVITAVEDGSND